MRLLKCAILCVAMLFVSTTAYAAPPVFTGNVHGLGDPVFNVKSHGATGSSGTDATAALQSAVNATLAANGTLFIPPGTYNDTGVTVNMAGKRINIECAQGAKIVNTATTSSNATSSFYVTGTNGGSVGGEWFGMSNCLLVGNATGGMGLNISNVYQGELKNINASGFTAPSGWGIGINLNYSIDFVITNPIVSGCAYAGLELGNASNANTVIGGWVYSNNAGAFGARVLSSNGNRFLGTVFESNPGGGLELLSGKNNSLYGVWVENNGNPGVYADDSRSIIDGSWFTTNTTNDIDVQGSSADLTIERNDFNDGGKITFESGSANTLVTENRNITTLTKSGGSYVLRGNPGLNPLGNVAAPAVPASGTAYTNTLGADATVFVNGGTVTAVSIGGTATGLTSGSFRVPAGQTITITYSVAPTWTWFLD